MLLRLLFFLGILTLIDLYVFSGLEVICSSLDDNTALLVYIIYWAITALTFTVIVSGMIIPWDKWPKRLRTYTLAFIFLIYFSKLVVVLFLFIDDIIRAIKYAYIHLAPDNSAFADVDAGKTAGGVSRSGFLVSAGFITALIPFTVLLAGMLRGKYEFRVKSIRIPIKGLPATFNNFRMIHISDLHTGSFMKHEPLERAVSIINETNPDVIFFTGDLVNNLHSEVLPHTGTLSKLEARHGVFSVLGNHDYGDYHRWESQQQKIQNLQMLIDTQREMGWDLLLDEHRYISIGNDRISVTGIQNWSARGNFSKYGDLKKAVNDLESCAVNILLSHDPSHWKSEVTREFRNIDLTLSGHTHGMQFGIELGKIRWSPVKYMYSEWAGLYREGAQYLYVNRGLGFLGYPGRVGILPEITMIELVADES